MINLTYIKQALLFVITLFVVLSAHGSVSLQQDADEMRQANIYQASLVNNSAQNQTNNLTQHQGKTGQSKSHLYGDWLFNGGFKTSSFSAINPNYIISQGDNLLVQLWGGLEFQAEITVDAQGNIYIPRVGPIKVLGVSNAELNNVIVKSIKRVYTANVEVYINLISSQKVKVFLSGLVEVPGIYEGQSADSILRFIDLAGGIKRDLGSYRNIQIKRNNKVLHVIDLYKFIEEGEMPNIQLQDGDFIFVGPKQGSVSIEGAVGFVGTYEIQSEQANIGDILNAVSLNDNATQVTVISPKIINTASSGVKEIEVQQYTLDEIKYFYVEAGAVIKVTSQLRADSISVQLLGEHNSVSEIVLPWGASLADLLSRIELTKQSNINAVQLFRKSVAIRQKDMLNASLSALEQNVLTTRSETNEAAQLRNAEAKTILAWIDKARQVETKGQVLLTDGTDPATIHLVQGDKVVIPTIRNLVMVHGEVLFPTAIAYQDDQNVLDFIQYAGGSNEDIDDMNIMVMKPNGTVVIVNDYLKDEEAISPGDEIFVLAKPDEKLFQLTKDITQVLYQVAASAAVFIAL